MRWSATKKKILILSAILLILIVTAILLFRCDHVWMDATCAAPQTCEICGKTKGDPVEHSYTAATCTLPPICRYCITPSGEPLGHDWQAATCIKGESCSRCNVSRGAKGPHTLGESTDGKTKPCTVCGESIKIQYVALTFDDGPSGQVTKDLLDGLKARNAKATFFLCGYRIKLFPDYPGLIAEYGNEVGLHTENHAYLSQLTSEQIRSEIRKELDRIPSDVPVRLLRPPGGCCSDAVDQVAGAMGLAIIGWNLDPKDWATQDTAAVGKSILDGVQDGDIILMHDMSASSVSAALNIVDLLTARGFRFVTVSELARIRDTRLIPGACYRSFPPETQ
jgi:peptidoglycan/xylan/chitin deacetylase (PgdA/CDA1 family)